MTTARIKKIALVGGGTGGTLMPLFAVWDRLRHMGNMEACVLGPDDAFTRKRAAEQGLDFYALPAAKLRRYASWQNLADLPRLLRAFRVARRVLQQQRVDVVFGGGGYSSVPVALAAWRLGIPVIVHQPDMQWGLTNRLCAPLAAQITVAVPELRESSRYAKKMTVCGNPVRTAVLGGDAAAAKVRWQLEPAVPVVLVLGGGTGSQALNHLVAQSMSTLESSVQVLHVTGEQRSAAVVSSQRYHPVDFLQNELADAYAAADIVITRAGISTLVELAALGKAVIVVPLPGTAQEENARFFVRRSAACVFNQEDGVQAFAAAVQDLVRRPDRRLELQQNIRVCNPPDADQKIAQILLRYLI